MLRRSNLQRVSFMFCEAQAMFPDFVFNGNHVQIEVHGCRLEVQLEEGHSGMMEAAQKLDTMRVSLKAVVCELNSMNKSLALLETLASVI